MKHKITKLGLIITFISVALIFSYFVKADETAPKAREALITYVEGEAKKRPVKRELWIEAEVNSAVVEGEKVKTLEESRAEIELSQESVIRLAERTTVDIVKLFEEEKRKAEETQLNVEEGDVWGSVSKIDDNSSFEINTDLSVSAIRGTVFQVSVDQDTTKLKVYEGEVKIENTALKNRSKIESETEKGKSDKVQPIQPPVPVEGPKPVSMEEWIKIVRNMQEVVISHDQPWLWLQRDINPNSAEEKSDWVKWNKKRDQERGK